MKTMLKSRSEVKTVHHDFGALDNRGRSVGCRITTSIRVYVPMPDDHPDAKWTYHGGRLGTFFTWCPRATRNGAEYGPGQNDHHCETIEQRNAEIAKYLKDARKRATKLAAK